VIAPAATASGPLDVTMTPIVDGGACGAIPSIEAKADLANLDVTIGAADFAKQDCQSSPPLTKAITITNYSTSAITATAGPLAAGSAFAFAGASTANVPAGSAASPTTGSIMLRLNKLGNPGLVTETVPVTISGLPPPSGGPRSADARVDVRGAVLAFAPSSLAFTSTCVGGKNCSKPTLPFDVTNSGNESIYILGWNVNGTQGNGNAWRPPGGTTMAVGTTTLNVTFAPRDSGNYGATIKPQPGFFTSALCNPTIVETLTGTAN
jgi:hypothetical protein